MKKSTLVISALALAILAAPAVAAAAGSSLAGWQSEGWSADDPNNAAYEAEERHAALYRLYNPYTGEHLYTTDAHERDSLAAVGWSVESDGASGAGVALVGDFEGMAANESYKPLYRLYNPYAGDHHYTTDKNEYDRLQPTAGSRSYSFGSGGEWWSPALGL